MKGLAIICLVMMVGCRAQDTAAITRKVVELDTNKDDKTDVRMEILYRGTQKVMYVVSKPNQDDVLTVTGRSYFAGGDLVMTEADDDRDGIFETVAVYGPGRTDMEVFTRQSDGSVKPVDAQTLAAYKKQNAAITELWDKAAAETDVDNVMELMSQAERKIRDAEKQKTDRSQ